MNDSLFVVFLSWSPDDETEAKSPVEFHPFPRLYDALRFVDYRKQLAGSSAAAGTLHIEVQERVLSVSDLKGDVLEYVVSMNSPNSFKTDYRPSLSL